MMHLSLYAGIGGEALAAHAAGMEAVAFCESDPWRRKVLARHWPHVHCFGSDEDVTTDAFRERGIALPDVISGGPPCQGWSVAGKRQGESDPRHRWPEMLRIIADFRPAWVVVENVPGFRAYAVSAVVPGLEGLGYECWPVLEYPVSAFGAPHRRMRCFVVAHSDDGRCEQRHAAEWSLPAPNSCRAMADSNEPRPQRLNPCEYRGGEPEAASGCGSCCPGHAAAEYGGEDEMGNAGGRARAGRTPEPWRETQGGTSAGRSGEAVGIAALGGRAMRGAAPGDAGQPAQPDENVGNTGISGWCGEPRRGAGALSANGHALTETRDAPDGQPEPRLGGVPRWLAEWMESPRWPVAPGLPQHGWEPPRLTTAREHRVKRLEALGNICVPQQVFPIFKAIVEVSR